MSTLDIPSVLQHICDPVIVKMDKQKKLLNNYQIKSISFRGKKNQLTRGKQCDTLLSGGIQAPNPNEGNRLSLKKIKYRLS